MKLRKYLYINRKGSLPDVGKLYFLDCYIVIGKFTFGLTLLKK